ncbi:MAG: hypothetical protein GXP38_14200 [Chloroflexi bacterium]|nr:hypothetical protein [Chloroflexota bacterium]
MWQSVALIPVCLIRPLNQDRIENRRSIEVPLLFSIQTSIHYPPIHQFQYYRQRYPHISLPRTEAVSARELTLPLFPTMSDEMVSWVIDSVLSGLSSRRE